MDKEHIDIIIFKEMFVRFERFITQLEQLLEEKKPERILYWLDNRDVCKILQISPRTLQYYRDSGSIPYTKLKQKVYYKPDDINEFLTALSKNK